MRPSIANWCTTWAGRPLIVFATALLADQIRVSPLSVGLSAAILGAVAMVLRPVLINPAEIEQRLRARPRVSEFAAVLVSALLVIFILPDVQHGTDFATYTDAVQGRYVTHDMGLAWYYPYWWIWPVKPIVALGATAGFIAMGLLNIAGLWFASRVFGGNATFVLLGYFTVRMLQFGTISGLVAGALAAYWWALHRDKPVTAGVLMLFSLAKLGWAVPVVLAMFLLSPLSWKQRAQSIATATLIGSVSLAVFGWWPLDVLQRAQDLPPAGNDALWMLIGPTALLLWVPALLLPAERTERVVLILTTAILATPYLQHYDFSILFTMGSSWLALGSWIAVGTPLGNVIATLLPIGVYLRITVPAAYRLVTARREIASAGQEIERSRERMRVRARRRQPSVAV